MTINRHNYEEFFILYMDNELKPEDRRMVEDFVQQHPDLKEELDLLLQYKMVPDPTVQYEDKEELMKENGHSLITLSNYEEWLSLYIDNELEPGQQAMVDAFISRNPSVQKDFALLQRSKLQPENIVFAHKASLYRAEEKVRAFPVRWWRAAAAILLLAAGLSFLFLQNRKPSGSEDIVITNPAGKDKPSEVKTAEPGEKEKPGGIAAGKQEAPVVNPIAEEKYVTPVAADKIANNGSMARTNKKTVSPGKNSSVNEPATVKKDEPVIAENTVRPTNNLPQPLNNPNTTITRPDEAMAYTTLPEKSQLRNATTNENVTSPNAQPSNIVQASYKENGNDLLDQPDERKNKNRGIFRKIARTFEKRTNIDPTDDENRLLVGGLAIRLK